VTGPGRTVEVVIALSILVSAAHAWRPLFSGKEPWVAFVFGLVHGLAFAGSLGGLGFDTWTLAVSVFGFNLGIECVQLLIVAAVLPVLIWTARYGQYMVLRMAGSALSAACALGWVCERGFGVSNPLAPLVDWLGAPPHWAIGLWFALVAVAIFQLRKVPFRSGFGEQPGS
jgi:hypothetical protein